MKKLLLTVIIISIIFFARKEIISYYQEVVIKEPEIRVYIDSCVKNVPIFLCRGIYNKISFIIPDRLINFLAPLSPENIFIKNDKLSFFVIFLPIYFIGLASFFYRFKRYESLFLIAFFLLFTNMVFNGKIAIGNWAVFFIIFTGILEAIVIIRRSK